MSGKLTQNEKSLRLLLKDCANGFYQFMYFLGKDVTNAQGNQLEEYGFVKSPSQGLKGTSCYTYESEECMIELYGSCASFSFGGEKVVFLRKRNRFYHWESDERCIAGLWSDEDIRLGPPQELFQAMLPVLSWWVDYEAWISSRFGHEYRERCHREWGKVGKPWLEPQAAVQWVEDFMTQGAEQVRPRRYALAA